MRAPAGRHQRDASRRHGCARCASPRQLLRSAYVAFFQLRGLPERLHQPGRFRADSPHVARDADPGHAWLGDDDLQCFVDALARPGALTAALAYYRQLPRDLAQLSPTARHHRADARALGRPRSLRRPRSARRPRCLGHDPHIEHFPTAGHWLNQQEPERVNEALVAFCAERDDLHDATHWTIVLDADDETAVAITVYGRLGFSNSCHCWSGASSAAERALICRCRTRRRCGRADRRWPSRR